MHSNVSIQAFPYFDGRHYSGDELEMMSVARMFGSVQAALSEVPENQKQEILKWRKEYPDALGYSYDFKRLSSAWDEVNRRVNDGLINSSPETIDILKKYGIFIEELLRGCEAAWHLN